MGRLNNLLDFTRASISSFFFTEDKLDLTKEEIKKDPTRPIVVNRYSHTMFSESVDPGIYGYSTPSEGLKTFFYSDAERCYRDAKVQACLDMRVNAVFQSKLHIIAADDTTPAAIELKQFIEEINSELTGSIEDKLKESAKIALWLGFSLAEVVPKWSESEQFKGKLIIDKIQFKRPGLFEFITDSYDDILAIHSLVNLEDFFEEARFLVNTSNSVFGNPYGTPIYDTVVKWVHAKQYVTEYAQRYIQKYGSGGIPAVEYDDPNDKDIAEELSKNLFEGCSVAIPTGVKASFIELGIKGSNDPFKPFLDYCDSQISLGIIGPDLSQGSGSHAADNVKKGERDIYAKDLRRIITELYNEKIIRPYIKFNFDIIKFPKKFYPRAEFIQINDINKTQFIVNVQIGIKNGILKLNNPVHVNFICENMEWPKLSDKEVEKMLAIYESNPNPQEPVPLPENVRETINNNPVQPQANKQAVGVN